MESNVSTKQNTNTRKNIQATTGIVTHDSIVRDVQGSSHLRRRNKTDFDDCKIISTMRKSSLTLVIFCRIFRFQLSLRSKFLLRKIVTAH
jgi:hypothetical protein